MNEPFPPQGQPGNSQQPMRPGPQPPPPRPGQSPGSIRQGVVPAQTAPPSDEDLEPLSLIEEEPHPPQTTSSMPSMMAPPPPKKITAFGADMVHKKHDWKRHPVKTGTGAIRVKSFHGKYSEQGLEYLDNAVNEWLDANPDVEVKFVTPTVMTFEGKIREAALVLNVWY